MIDKLKSHSVGKGKSNQQVATQKERRLLITSLKFSGQATKHIADYIARKYNLKELAYKEFRSTLRAFHYLFPLRDIGDRQNRSIYLSFKAPMAGAGKNKTTTTNVKF